MTFMVAVFIMLILGIVFFVVVPLAVMVAIRVVPLVVVFSGLAPRIAVIAFRAMPFPVILPVPAP